MPLSIKQKQVLGVTSIVVLVVVVLSVLHLVSLTRVLLEQSRHRGELIALTIYHRAQDVVVSAETGYQDLRRDPAMRTALESALYSENVAYAAIVDSCRHRRGAQRPVTRWGATAGGGRSRRTGRCQWHHAASGRLPDRTHARVAPAHAARGHAICRRPRRAIHVVDPRHADRGAQTGGLLPRPSRCSLRSWSRCSWRKSSCGPFTSFAAD